MFWFDRHIVYDKLYTEWYCQYLSTSFLLNSRSSNFVDRFSYRASTNISARLEFTRTLLGTSSPLSARSSYVIILLPKVERCERLLVEFREKLQKLAQLSSTQLSLALKVSSLIEPIDLPLVLNRAEASSRPDASSSREFVDFLCTAASS